MLEFKALILDDPTRRETVKGTPCGFKGYEAFTLAVHPDPCNPETFRVSETITGRALTAPKKSAKEATATCEAFLKTVTPQQLGDRISYYLLGPGREEA